MENYSRELYEKMMDKSQKLDKIYKQYSQNKDKKLKEKWYNVLKA